MFDAKRFYRKLETLFHAVGTTASEDQLLPLVLHDVVAVLGEELRISNGALYRIGARECQPIETALAGSPKPSIPSTHPSIDLITRHGTYIFGSEAGHESIPGWTGAVLALVLGHEPLYVLVFALAEQWEREQLEFAFNTLRTYVNQRLASERLHHDLLEAHVVQTSLLPSKPPTLKGFSAVARSVPAQVVGGDFYDWIPLSTDSIVIAIGDASGHGIPAALQVRDVVTGLRMGIGMEFRLTTIASRLNRVVHQSNLSSRFVSMFVGELSTNGDLLYVNAGHVSPLVIRARGTETLQSTGLVLGPAPEALYRRGYTRLHPGDLLVLYSDGITEREDQGGRQFGDVGFPGLLRKARMCGPANALEMLFDAALGHGSGPWTDDATLVLVRMIHDGSTLPTPRAGRRRTRAQG